MDSGADDLHPVALAQVCPSCGKLNDCVSCLSSPGAAPRPGDVTICIGCRGVLQFKDDLSLRIVEPGELEQWVKEGKLDARDADRLRKAQFMMAILVKTSALI